MRYVILISLAVFLIVVVGGYGITWYSQASTAKSSLERIIAKINEKDKYLTYDAIETSGFPTNVFVTIVRPHFSGRMDQLLKALHEPELPEKAIAPAPGTTPPNPFASMPEWNEDNLLDGRIVFGVNALSDHYSMSIEGNWQETSTIAGKAVSTLHQQTGSTSCTLQLQRTIGIFDTLWNFKSLGDEGRDFFKDFRMVDCNNAGNSLIDSATKTTFGSSGPIRIYITSAPQANTKQMRFYINAADIEITQQGDAMMDSYFHALSPKYPYPINFSVYGKQNVDIDFAFTVPTDWQKEGNNPPLDIALSKFDLTNQVYNHHMTFFLNNATNQNKVGPPTRVSKLTFQSESDFSEQYDTLLQTALRGFIQQTYASQNPQLKDLQAVLQKYTPDQMYSIIYLALPNFHSLGKVVEALDVSFDGAPDLTTGDIKLSALEVSMSPYAIKGMGNAKLSPDHPPAGNLTISCNNCLHLIDDTTAYAGRLQTMVNYFDPSKAAVMTIDPRQVEAYKTFLSALAAPMMDPKDNTTWNYIITSDPSSGMTVINRSGHDLIAMYNEYLRPVLKQPTAADGAQPAH